MHEKGARKEVPDNIGPDTYEPTHREAPPEIPAIDEAFPINTHYRVSETQPPATDDTQGRYDIPNDETLD